MKPLYAFVRIKPIRSKDELNGQSRHAQRAGERLIAKLRPGAVPGTCISTSIFKPDPKNYREAFELEKIRTGAHARKGAAICLQFLLMVSPEWIEEEGNLHDPENPRNVALFNAAINFARTEVGNVISARLDLDETGGGVVDVFCMPVRLRETKTKKDGTRKPFVPEISCRKALKEVQHRTSETRSYSALQTRWAEYAVANLDPRLLRGKPKVETGREHLTVEEYKAAAETTKREQYEAKQLQAENSRLASEIRVKQRRLCEQEEAAQLRRHTEMMTMCLAEAELTKARLAIQKQKAETEKLAEAAQSHAAHAERQRKTADDLAESMREKEIQTNAKQALVEQAVEDLNYRVSVFQTLSARLPPDMQSALKAAASTVNRVSADLRRARDLAHQIE